MKKLSLDLDRLAVESFHTAAIDAAGGTVRGHGVSDTTCVQIVCDCPTGSGESCADCGEPTALDTCNQPSCYTCVNTCVLAQC